jgi:hypothetical protein
MGCLSCLKWMVSVVAKQVHTRTHFACLWLTKPEQYFAIFSRALFRLCAKLLLLAVWARRSKSESKIPYDRGSVSPFWCPAPPGAHGQISVYVLNTTDSQFWGALSDENEDLTVGFVGCMFLHICMFRLRLYTYF